VTGEMSSLVGGVEGVDEGVNSGAVGAGGHAAELLGDGIVRGESGGVGVVLEVTVGRVVGVDERVEVGINGSINIVIVYGGSNLLDGGGGSLNNRGRLDGGGLLGVEGGRVESVGSGGNMRSVKDSESVLAGGVLHGVGLTVIADVAVLTDTLTSGSGLLSEDDSIFLGKGRAEPSVSSVETLLLQDLGVLGVNKLTGGSSCQTRCYNKLQHF